MLTRCSGCRTSLDDDTICCPHGVTFCGDCTWEESCEECNLEAIAATSRMTPTARLVTDADPETDEWFAARREGITGTDLPKILGLSKYGNALSVWLDKRGELDDEAREAARWGQILEDPVAVEWARRNNTQVSDVGVLAHIEHDWMRVSLDRLVLTCPDGDGPCALEVKTRSAFKAHEWADGIPDAVLAQTGWGLMVTGLDHHHVAALIGGQRLVSYRVDRDPKLETYLHEAAVPVWQAVKEGVPPEAHPDTEGVLLDLLNRIYGNRAGERDLPPTAADWLVQYADAHDMAKEADRLKTQAKTALVQMLDDGDTGLLDGRVAFTYKCPDPGLTLSSASLKRLREEQPDNYSTLCDEGYVTTTSPGPRFALARTTNKETTA